MRAIRIARDRGLSAFETDRAANATDPDEVFFERQTYLNLADLAHLPDARVKEIIERHGLASLTPSTLTDPDALREDLDQIRAE